MQDIQNIEENKSPIDSNSQPLPDNKPQGFTKEQREEMMNIIKDALGSIIKPSNEPSTNNTDTNALPHRKDLNNQEIKNRQEREKEKEISSYYGVLNDIVNLPFSSDDKKEVVTKSLDNHVKNRKDEIPYDMLINISKAILVKEELDLNDPKLKFHKNYKALTDLKYSSKIEEMRIINPEVLDLAYDETIAQMQYRDKEKVAQERLANSSFSPNLDYSNISGEFIAENLRGMEGICLRVNGNSKCLPKINVKGEIFQKIQKNVNKKYNKALEQDKYNIRNHY